MVAKRRWTRTGPAAAARNQARPHQSYFTGSTALKLCVGMLVSTLVLLPDYVAAGENTAYLQSTDSPSSVQQGPPVRPAPEAHITTARGAHRADFGRERVSRDARQIADWVVDSADNQGLPFVIVDKIDARIFVFEASGRIKGASAALVGSARGDDTVPGIGDRAYADMPPSTRTTPAGRFVAALGMNTRGEDVVWVDYEAAVDIHRVVTNVPKDHRLERLATPTPLDNRISYGCINVPKRFYEKVVAPAFAGTYGIVYVLPETRPAREAFGSYDVDERSDPNRMRSASAQH